MYQLQCIWCNRVKVTLFPLIKLHKDGCLVSPLSTYICFKAVFHLLKLTPL